MNQMGIKTPRDQAASAIEVFYTLNSLNPESMTRFFAKPEYNDKAAIWPGYNLLMLNQVTKILTKKQHG